MSTRTAPAAAARSEPAQAPVPVTIVAHDIGDIGGMERVLGELVLGLRGLGHDVVVVARTCAVPEGSGVEFHRVPGPARPVLLAYPWFLLAGSLLARLRRRGIVQATGAIVLNRADVVAVHYLHQAGPARPSRATPLYRLHAALVGLMVRAGERLCFRMSARATFVGVSEGVAEEVRRHYPRLAARVISIQNGVDTDTFAPGVRAGEARELRERLGIAPGRLAAVFVGSEWERKGLEPLIRALAQAREWDVVVAGGGERERYEELARSLEVRDAVHWLGVTSDVQLAYQLGDAFVLPSEYETFSLVTYEAAASGLPLLATPVSGIRELLRDGVNGYFIDREPATIAARLRELGADAALRERFGEQARSAALGFGWRRMVERHHELYERLASSRAG